MFLTSRDIAGIIREFEGGHNGLRISGDSSGDRGSDGGRGAWVGAMIEAFLTVAFAPLVLALLLSPIAIIIGRNNGK